MINIYKDLRKGALDKKEFIIAFLFLLVVQFLFLYLTLVAIVGSEYLMSGSISEIQNILMDKLALPYLFIFLVFLLLILISKVIIFTKRTRGIGVKADIAWIGGFLSIVGGIDILLAIILFFIPTGYFKNK